MSIKIIEQRLKSYDCKSAIEEQQALKEILQELILMSLSRHKFFSLAEFHGGTALRILYGLSRFSEDLDFALLDPNLKFSLSPYLAGIAEELKAFGFELVIKDRSKSDKAIKSAFLKDNSIGKQLILLSAAMNQSLNIKIEVDANPPVGVVTEVKYLNFPSPFSVTAKDLPSSFAGKLHALLCRQYIKGRDWYDFIWYITNKVTVNMALLQSALRQVGPWQSSMLNINGEWVFAALKQKIKSIDWHAAVKDIQPFIKPFEQDSLALWSKSFFLQQVDQMEKQGLANNKP
ncbi:MAG: nucleotidyl transferase AbiEii/AbiGii toxin family protein [Coxiellaceae bacterium]|nr:nucleotidyl transferase AbiEii/AbiGii toxin family protein [Coxiellaceae bacterium]